MSPLGKVQLLGTKFENISSTNLVDWLLDQHPTSTPIRFMNVHSIVEQSRHTEYANSIASRGVNFADGSPLILLSWLFNRKKLTRVRGFDFFSEIVKSPRVRNRHIFIVPNQIVAARLTSELMLVNPEIAIGAIILPPHTEDLNELLKFIHSHYESMSSDIVWIGLGGVKQDLLADSLSSISKTAVGVGAAFNFYVGHVPQCPKFLSTMGLEWLFRICVEPKRLWKRYLFDLVAFLRILILKALR
jgi:N-acetylglucosaminyldiphosphoundecaprenol N-acetyl-beta-D-mannosaminyltransferase